MPQWKPIPNYEGLYEASDLGQIKSLKRVKNYGTHQQTTKERILKPSRNKKGYLQVVLYDKEGNKKTYKVHRLVALAFLDNPENLPIINHKNLDVKDNTVSNLEWCTNQYNILYSQDMQYCCQKDGKTVIVKNLSEFCRENNLHLANAFKVLRQQRTHTGGWKFSYIYGS